MSAAQAGQCPYQLGWTDQCADNGDQQQSQTRKIVEPGTESIQGVQLGAEDKI